MPRRTYYAEIAVAILVIALVVLSYFLIQQYRITARQTAISSERARFASLRQTHPLTIADAGLIAPWMTFDYVSVSFKVPASYLASALGISAAASGYPNITLGHYAHSIATSSTAFVIEVQSAVRAFLAPGSAASASPASSPNAPVNGSATTGAPQEE